METVNDRKLRDDYLEKRRIYDLFSTCVPNFFLLHYQPGELLTNPFSPSQYLQFVVEGELLLYDMPDEDSSVMLQTSYKEITLLGVVELLAAPCAPCCVLAGARAGPLARELLLYDLPDEDATVLLQTSYNEINLLGEVELLDAQFTPFFVEARTDVYTLALYLEQYQQILLNDPAFLRYHCSCQAALQNRAVTDT